MKFCKKCEQLKNAEEMATYKKKNGTIALRGVCIVCDKTRIKIKNAKYYDKKRKGNKKFCNCCNCYNKNLSLTKSLKK
jgi:hypothetical protein